MENESEPLRTRHQITYHNVSEKDMLYWGQAFSAEVANMKVNSIDCGREYVVLEVELPERAKVIFYGKRNGEKLTDALANMVEAFNTGLD